MFNSYINKTYTSNKTIISAIWGGNDEGEGIGRNEIGEGDMGGGYGGCISLL